MAIRARRIEDPSNSLSDTLRLEIELARARLDNVRARRRDYESQLEAARQAEESMLESLEALESVGRHAGLEVPERAATYSIEGLVRLSGAELRERIARVALRRGSAGEAVHWRTWLGWLRDAKFDASGKNPEATFQTQLSRSPLVRRTEQDGIYVLDLGQVRRGRDELHRLHDQLARLPPADQLALVGDVRARRQELQNEIARTERAVEEMWRVLAQERPPGSDDDITEPEHLAELWTGRQVRTGL